MSSQNLKIPEFHREHRLGLVVYGGVSLAIYMNGICREFYNAVRGRGIYKLIKALTDSDIIVDIVSGTSAGGINGVLLSYALANSTEDKVVDFEEFAPIWRDDANIRSLMYDPSPWESKIESVLDGSGYYQTKLADTFKAATNNKDQAPEGEWLSQFNELDLFVTGTDLLGRVYQVFDDTGAVIEVKDHRTLFHLKHRQGRKEPFNPNTEEQKIDPADPTRTSEVTYQSLGKLCRITSCFPVAFPVVEVGIKEDANLIDQQLVKWGILSNRTLPEQQPEGGYKVYFVDGGVLDNKPFTYTLKAIYYRTANRPVERKLFYIDASPENFSGGSKFNQMSKPNVLSVVQESLVGLPSYESITNDLQLLKEHNEKVRRYKSLVKDAEIPGPLTRAMSEISEKLNINEEIYLRSRLISLRDHVLPLVLRMDQIGTAYSDKNKQEILEKTGKLLTEAITDNTDTQKQGEILYETSQQIRNLDVDYALRKHFYITQKLGQIIGKRLDALENQENKKGQILLGRINRQIKLLEVIKSAVDELLSEPKVSEDFYKLLEDSSTDQAPDSLESYSLRNQVYDHLLRLHRFLLDTDSLEDFSPQEVQKPNLEPVAANFLKNLPLEVEKLGLSSDALDNSEEIDWLPQKLISSILEQLRQKIRKIDNNPSRLTEIWSDNRFQNNEYQNDGDSFSTVLRQVELATENLIEASGLAKTEEILFRFRSFRQLDRVLYPFEYLTDIKEKDLVKIIRFSPEDAQLGFGKGKSIGDKLGGDNLRAFGGFFKKSWRSNDLLWGRLDGLNRIVEALVTPESLKHFSGFLERESARNGCTQEEYLDFLVEQSFPHAQQTRPKDLDKIKNHLRLLADPDLQLSKSRFKSILDDFVLEGHREIVNKDLKNVIEDEVAEQLEWNQQRVKVNSSSKLSSNEAIKYEPVPGYFERTVSTLAAGEIAKQSVESLSSQQKESLFRKQYSVGKETVLKDIPILVLTNLVTRFTLVLRDITLTSLGDRRASQLRRRLTYQFFNKSLQLFYWWLQFTAPLAMGSNNFRGKQPLILVAQVVLSLIAVVAVAVTVLNSPELIAVAFGAAVLCWLLEYSRKKA
ncbi:patatin-like protein [Lyngbya aestuarii]|uniref:patatin-like protein n=1 Tax=Lyngbya aestuarii TaxID=118322 RepID=UPI00403D8E92